MIDKGIRLAGSLVALTLLGGAAEAAPMTFPKDHPVIAMDVPDGWAVATTPLGLELRAPENNSIIAAKVLGREKSFLDTWANQAAARLKTFGVAFDANATAPAKPAAAPPHVDSVSAFTTRPDAFTFSGQPSLATPGTAGSNDPVKAGQTSVESLTGFGAKVTPMPKIPFRAVQYFGTTMAGKPVDVQLVIYNLPDNRLFVMMQESGPDDGRAVAIAQSVQGVK